MKKIFVFILAIFIIGQTIAIAGSFGFAISTKKSIKPKAIIDHFVPKAKPTNTGHGKK